MEIQTEVMVAQDGTGNYMTVSEALEGVLETDNL